MVGQLSAMDTERLSEFVQRTAALMLVSDGGNPRGRQSTKSGFRWESRSRAEVMRFEPRLRFLAG